MSGKFLSKRFFHTALLFCILAAASRSAAGTLTNVRDSLSTYASGAMAVHIIKFTNVIPISRTGSITIRFPDSTSTADSRFRMVSGQVIAGFGSVSPATSCGGFSSYTVAGDSVRCIRDGTGTDISTGSTVTLLLALIRNPLRPRLNVTVTVRHWDGGSPANPFDSGLSSPFHIDGPAASFSLASVGAQASGVPFMLQVYNAKDVYGHGAGGTLAVSATSGGGAAPDGTLPSLNPILLNNGAGQSSQVLFKAESGVVLQAASTLTTKTTNAFTVTPGAAGRLLLSGEPLTLTAGATLPNAIIVQALDKHDNLATTYSGTVTFNNNDPGYLPGDLPGSSALTAGQLTSAGSNFRLRTAGARKIWVSDGTLSDTTGVINVTGGGIESYTLTVSGTPMAGQPATLNVSGAVDAYGNAASGTVTVAFADGNANHAIGGNTPVFSSIAVSNGTGSGTATFYRSEGPVSVQGLAGSVAVTSNTFQVVPGPLGRLVFIADPSTLTPLPVTLTAGDSLGAAADYLLVTLQDSYGNVKTDFTGTLSFSSSDVQAVYPAAYSFTAGDLGSKRFPRDLFRLKTAGNQTFTAQAGGYTQKLDPILVTSDLIRSFTLSAGTTQTAGGAFNVTVSNARDKYNNAASGVVEISATAGGGAAPNGQLATLTAIPVSNGSGLAAQILVKTETVLLRGRALDGSTELARYDLPAITVKPGALGSLELSGLPASIPVKTTFPGAVTVTAFDRFGNLKTDYSGTVHFSSSAAVASLPPDKVFTNTAQFSFVGAFSISTPGLQTITVRDLSASPVVATTSNPIDVSALLITALSATPTKVSQGQSGILVAMGLENYGASAVTSLGGGLHFRTDRDADSDYTWTWPSGANQVPPMNGSTPGKLTVTIPVAVSATAGTGSTRITGFASGLYNGAAVSVDDTTVVDTWLVQQKAALTLKSVRVVADTVNQGQSGILIECVVQNGSSSGLADAAVTGALFSFRLENVNDVSPSFPVTAATNNESIVPAGQSKTLRYYMQSSITAPIGRIYLYPSIQYNDQNSQAAGSTGESASDLFFSQEAGALQITEITPSQPAVTREQPRSWSITVGVQNTASFPLEIDFNTAKTHLEFRRGGTDYSAYFTILNPPVILSNNAYILAKKGATGDSSGIVYIINNVNAPPGTYSIVSRIETTDGIKTSDAFGSIEVQSEADLYISKIIASQSYATVNDASWPWYIDVGLTNQGGSTVEIDTVNSTLNFSVAGFVVGVPKLVQNQTILRGNQSDLLRFPVRRNGSAAGAVSISATVYYYVQNYGAQRAVPASALRGSVTLQKRAENYITGIRLEPAVLTEDKAAPWRVILTLTNQPDQGDVELNLTNSDSTFVRFSTYALPLPTRLAGNGTKILKSGSTDSLIFTGVVPITDSGLFPVTARVAGRDINSNLPVQATPPQTPTLEVQNPPNLMAMTKSIQPAYVSGGTVYRFQINVMNTGGASVMLDPARTHFSFGDGITTYSALLDDSFGATLPGGSTRTLYFRFKDLLASIKPGTYQPRLELAGMENGNSFSDTLDLSANKITVASPREVMITSLGSAVETVTAGQSRPWYIDLQIRNNGSSTLRLDSTRIVFYHNSVDISNAFALVKPDTFLTGEAKVTAETDAILRYRVDAVDATLDPGQVIISGRIWMTDDAQAFRRFDEQTDQGNSGYVMVQAPADPVLVTFKSSQSSITRGQTVSWTISAVLRNRGGSTLALDTSSVALHFSAGDTLFTVRAPGAFLSRGDSLLLPGKEDSVRWSVESVSARLPVPGTVRVDGSIRLSELNSGRTLLLNTATASAGFDLAVQDSAVARLAGLRLVVPQDSLVDGGQTFYVQACIKSLPGRDGLLGAQVRFAANGYLTFPSGRETSVGPIAAGDSLWTVPGIIVRADTTSGVNPTLFAHLFTATAANTRQKTLIHPALAEKDSSKTLRIQKPGALTITRMVTSQDSIPSGYGLDWTIQVDVTNPNEGALMLDPPRASDITIKQGFVVRAPALAAAQRRIARGDTLHLVYEVIASSSGSGRLPINAQLSARDINDTLRVVSTSATTSIYISTSARVRIARTSVNAESYYVDSAGIGHLNTRQPFQLEVDVENNGGQALRSVYVRLTGQRSVVTPGLQLMENLSSFEGPRRVRFAVIADSVENLAGETFTAEITQATGEDGAAAFISPATDATAMIRIYRPAVLKLLSTSALTPNPERIVSYGQTFPVEVVIRNQGSEPVSGVTVTAGAEVAERVTIAGTPLVLEKTITAGDTARARFMVTAGSKSGQVLIRSAITASVGQNTRLSAPLDRADQDSSTLVTIESNARLKVLSVRAPVAITAGDAQNDWRIYVKVKNEGDADLRFIGISPANLSFYTNGVQDPDYRVNAPAKLMGADSLVLRGQSQDSLLYIVTRNGDIAGTCEVRVQLNAMDLNRAATAENLMSATGTTTLEVSSTSWVRLNQTTVDSAKRYDNQNLALINRGQLFKIAVEAETSELTGVDSVWIQLSSDGGSSILQPRVVIPAIGKGSRGRAIFTVVADDSWEAALGEKRETFTAQILSARTVGSALYAQIRQPERPADAFTAVRVQNPARIAIGLFRESGQDSILTAGQAFKLLVSLRNLGTAAMENGKYTVLLPAGKKYQLAAGPAERSFSVPLGMSVRFDTLSLISPVADSFSDTIRVQLTQAPQDVNIARPAATETTIASSVVTTLKSGLLLSLSINAPAGAQDGILSTAQQIVLRAIVQATDNIHQKSVTLQLPTTVPYVLLSAAEQDVTASRDTLYWRLQVPGEETVMAHTFQAEARGRSADGWQTVQQRVTINQIVGRANLWIDNLEVSSPAEGVMESGQANFSVRQQATLRTRVRNLGTARVGTTGKLTLSLQRSGLKLMGTDSTKSFTAGSYVTWNVQASDTEIREIRDIRVDISTAPNDENTNAPATIANGTATLNVMTEARGTIKIENFYISGPSGARDNSVSAEQSFVATAEITSTKVRDLQAELSYTGAFSTNTPSVAVALGSRQVVNWTIKAPAEAGNNTLTVTVSGKDYRSSTVLTNQLRTLAVTTEPVSRYILTPKIIFPSGLTNKVSSESPFRLAFYIQHQAGTAPSVAADAATIRLNVPARFLDGTEPLLKTGLDSLAWNLVAPAVGQDTLFDVSFTVTDLPRDANSGLPSITDLSSVYYPIWVVRKARLEILAQVPGQSGISPVAVRIGNEFDLTALLHNLGSADYYGSYQVRLELPTGYNSRDALTVSTTQDTVRWRIKAPDKVSEVPDTLVVRLLSAPRDYFSKKAAEIVRDSALIFISPEAGFMVARSFPVRSSSVGLRGGTDVPMLGLSLQNKDHSIGSRSLLDSIKVSFRNRKGSAVAARSVVSRIAAVRHGSSGEVLAENRVPGSSSEVYLNFVKALPDTIRSSDLFVIDIVVDIAAAADLADFVVAIDSANAIVARDAIYHNRLSMADSTLNRVHYLGFSSGTLVVMQSDLAKSFCNYPNPFGTAARPVTKFVYYLEESSDIQIKIFTLTGDLVQAWEYTKAAHPAQTSAGVHQDDVVWDGRNGRGEKVMNGIYLAYLKTEKGELALSKIAVVK